MYDVKLPFVPAFCPFALHIDLSTGIKMAKQVGMLILRPFKSTFSHGKSPLCFVTL